MEVQLMEKLLTYMKAHDLDGFFVSKLINVRYISRYTSDDAYLLVTNRGAFFLTDPRYIEQAENECPDYEIVNWRSGGGTVAGAIRGLIDGMGLKRVAFEGDAVSYDMYAELRETGAGLVPLNGVIENMRSVKTVDEIQNLRAACDIADRAFTRILNDIRVGITEKELASRLSHYMVLEGSDTKPYGNILISGKRTSLLHGIPSNKVIEYGDFVLMDFGCGFNGYLSDMTRTVVAGKATDRQKEVYALEQQMLKDATEAMLPGASAQDVYEASIRAIKDTEYFQYHYSGVGHGIGLFVHEHPFMNPQSEAVLQENNVITIEPGIYIPDWGGVRIEDQILITEHGNESLIHSTRDLIEL